MALGCLLVIVKYLGGVANIINHSANIDVCCVVINVTDKPFYGRIREMNSDYIFENIIH